jgi:hypothetical protein
MSLRYLTKAEIAIGSSVFQDSLPWRRIQLSDRYGFGDRPYAMGRTIHVGDVHFKGMDKSHDPKTTPQDGPSVLVHELTHVWQSEHSVHRAGYIFGSIEAQIEKGSAYSYTLAGQNWDDYDPEQQAQIVQDWYFKDGQSQQSKRWPFIRDYIRKKHIAPDDRIEYSF